MKHYDSGIKQETMTITYKDGVKLIHHPSGIVQELDAKDLAAQKVQLEAQKTKIELEISAAGKSITDAVATKVKK